MKKILLFLIFFIYPLSCPAINAIPEGEGVNLLPCAVNPKNIRYVKDIGFDFVRTGTIWSTVEKKRGVYDWTYYDYLIKTLISNGLKPLIIIGFNHPMYGAREVFTGVSTEEQRQGFARYAAALVNRYKGRGIVWEIWNEPSIGEFWKPSPNFKDYSLMANMAVDEIRKTAPNEIVIAPGIPIPNCGEFFKIIEKDGLFNKIDAVSFHFYPYITYENQTPEGLTIPYFVNAIQNQSKRSVVCTETGWSTAWPTMDERKQAAFLARQMVINRANGINLGIWHNLIDYGYSKTDPEMNFGLIRHDYTPRPSYYAVKYIIKKLKGKKFVKKIDLPSKSDYAYVFTDGKSEYLFAWTTGKRHDVTIGGHSLPLSEYVVIALLN